MAPASHPPSRSPEIDALKGVAVAAVVVLHALSASALDDLAGWFHVGQSVPVFAVLLGFTGRSARVRPIGRYLLRRAVRFVPGFLVAALLIVSMSERTPQPWNPWRLFGELPVPSPGNYFITLMLEFVLLLPFLRLLWKWSPEGTVALSFAVSFGYEVLAFSLHLHDHAYSSSVFRYLFAIALGMWLAEGRRIWPLVPLSLGYLAAYSFGFRVPFFIADWRPQDVLAFGYSAGLVALALRILPKRMPKLEMLGRASYHVFLAQMVWFALLPPSAEGTALLMRVYVVLVSLGVCVPVGLAWARAEDGVTGLFRATRRVYRGVRT